MRRARVIGIEKKGDGAEDPRTGEGFSPSAQSLDKVLRLELARSSGSQVRKGIE